MEGLSAIRPLAPRDLDAVLAIQAASPEIARWSRRDYERVCADLAAAERVLFGWIAEQGNEVAGFLVARLVADEMEILNLAVRADARRAGVASKLLAEAFAQGRTQEVRRVFLEVRESNAAAIAFYRQHGFSLASRRKQYYHEPEEDALIFERALGEV